MRSGRITSMSAEAMPFSVRQRMNGRAQWALRALSFGLGLISLGELGFARDILTGQRAAVPAHLAVVVDVMVGVSGVPLAWKLWHRSMAATYWLTVWCAGLAASQFMLFLGDVKPVDRGAIIPFAAGLVIWTAGTWWVGREIRQRLTGEGSEETA